jgi:hypothetical protein
VFVAPPLVAPVLAAVEEAPPVVEVDPPVWVGLPVVDTLDVVEVVVIATGGLEGTPMDTRVPFTTTWGEWRVNRRKILGRGSVGAMSVHDTEK